MTRKLETRVVEKVWGTKRPPFPIDHASGDPIGEVWFVPPPEIPEILVKHIFTSERLSVQVHPDDAQARQLGVGMTGKNECWLITDADDDASIAAGFNRTLTREELRKAALDGSVLDLLTWHKVRAGDFFYIPAGTVHAIGAGVSLVEVQQNCDITFRLFDYGRPRELHLDQGLQVANLGPYPADLRKHVEIGRDTRPLIENPNFSASLVHGAPATKDIPALLIPISGSLEGQACALTVGDCAIIDGEIELKASDDAATVVVISAA